MDYATIRPPTPDSPLTNRDSLYDATTTIDDLTLALENVSRVPSPEPTAAFFCCCGRDDCENVQAWMAVKARLETRLTLSAEVGQALLQRHEAYVRRHESRREAMEEDREESDGAAAEAQDRLDELTKENKALEKRLTQALVNNEVTEVSNKTILQELAEAKMNISRMTTSAARSVGWETRLSAVMKDKDDMQQERDSESQRARLAESRFAALKDRTSKLQADVRRLQNALEEKREHRLESSESIIMDARARLEALHRSVGAPEEQPELTSVLQTLVDDNETLKRDNAELQTLLADAREDCRALQEEVEEQRVIPPPRSGAATPSHLRQHFHSGSVPNALNPSFNFGDRRTSRRYEPLTPETNRRPLSPADSATTSETKWTYFGQAQARYPRSPSHASFDIEEQDEDTTMEKRTPHKPLFLLSRSRGVQTDPYPQPPTPGPYPPSKSPSSAASIYSDSAAPSSIAGASNPPPSASLATLIERTQGLLQRMQAADALSLTNRLKRAGIRGADVAHLSRTTVAGIVSDAGKQLRTTVGQDDELRAGRRDVRTLLGVLREIFGTLGEMRVLLNEVVLDPSSATRVSEAAMDPDGADGKAASGWMAPLSKLFAGSPAPREGDRERAGAASPLAAPRPIAPRFVPKLGPALAASATTVNVEFSGAGAGVGRAMTSTVDATPAMPVPTRPGGGGSNGAPHQGTPSRPPSLLSPAAAAFACGRAAPSESDVTECGCGVGWCRGLLCGSLEAGDASGDEEPDYLAPLLQRTLRRRGLSDSSIHSTFAAQAAEDEAAGAQPPLSPLSRTEATWLESGSVLQALSRRVQSFRSGLSVETTPQERPEGASLSGSELRTSPPKPTSPVAVGPSRRSSRASRDTSSKAISATPSGFGFLANLVPTRSMQNNSMISRTYRAPEAGSGI
ncbi:hypothetical protein R3P38DRAFT_3384266 [Favolaschia claudopus]|uniref:Uncharacterized protein n=1 Tax=Favolaschia claudopus TaxID=2862362 RepID=A0AAW0EDQ2_9AGAR